jgi:hypothetical protein
MEKLNPNEQYTWELETTKGLDYLVLYGDENVEEMFELYKNDEAGEHLKNAKLISYRRIN